jgi:hypothetical protein
MAMTRPIPREAPVTKATALASGRNVLNQGCFDGCELNPVARRQRATPCLKYSRMRHANFCGARVLAFAAPAPSCSAVPPTYAPTASRENASAGDYDQL